MKSFLTTTVVAAAAFVLSGCANTTSPTAVTAAPMQSSGRAIDACSLLTANDLESIQGESIRETRPNTTSNDRLLISECVYVLPTFSKSVSVRTMYARPDDSATAVADYWNEIFHRDVKKKLQGSFIEGIGEEAHWSESRAGGVLFVRAKETIVRVSVGGAAGESGKLEVAKRLAMRAIEKL